MALKRWIPWLVTVALVGAGIALVRELGITRDQAGRLARLSAQSEQLRRQVDELARHAAAAAAPAAPSEPPVEGKAGAARPAKPGINPQDVIATQRLKLSLADANASVNRLQQRVEEAEAKVQNLTVDNKRLTASETDLQQSLSSANQAIDALQTELKGKDARVTQLETAYQKIRAQTGGDAQKLAQVQQLAAELQEIHQRREAFLNSILRRYKQITEQYRSMSGVLQAQRTEGPSTSSTDLARIQDSIAMAEEDLRQLNGLNAQALRVLKKMSGK